MIFLSWFHHFCLFAKIYFHIMIEDCTNCRSANKFPLVYLSISHTHTSLSLSNTHTLTLSLCHIHTHYLSLSLYLTWDFIVCVIFTARWPLPSLSHFFRTSLSPTFWQNSRHTTTTYWLLWNGDITEENREKEKIRQFWSKFLWFHYVTELFWGRFHQTLCAKQKVAGVQRSMRNWLFSFTNALSLWSCAEFFQITAEFCQTMFTVCPLCVPKKFLIDPVFEKKLCAYFDEIDPMIERVSEGVTPENKVDWLFHCLSFLTKDCIRQFQLFFSLRLLTIPI